MPGDCKRDAEKLLRDQRHMVAKVVSVDRDSILYLSPMRVPRTAWLHGDKVVKTEPGFNADPPAGLHDGEGE